MNLSLCGDTREAEDHDDQRCCISRGSSFLSLRSRLTMSMGRELGFGETFFTRRMSEQEFDIFSARVFVSCASRRGQAWGPAMDLERFH